MEQQSYLSDIEFNPVLASTGQRFLNYLIDHIILRIISYFFGFAMVLSANALDSYAYYLQLWLTVFFILTGWFLYYFLSELVFKGRTIAKFITGTRAVNKDCSEMSAKTVLLRTLSRIVPFEPFSAFGGQPWHDKWSKTYVIDVKKTGLNNIDFQQQTIKIIDVDPKTVNQVL